MCPWWGLKIYSKNWQTNKQVWYIKVEISCAVWVPEKTRGKGPFDIAATHQSSDRGRPWTIYTVSSSMAFFSSTSRDTGVILRAPEPADLLWPHEKDWKQRQGRAFEDWKLNELRRHLDLDFLRAVWWVNNNSTTFLSLIYLFLTRMTNPLQANIQADRFVTLFTFLLPHLICDSFILVLDNIK